MSHMTSCENALCVIFKSSARPWNGLLSRFVWPAEFVRLDYKLANVSDGGVTHDWLMVALDTIDQ